MHRNGGKLNILFLGAGKRLSLLEYFLKATHAEKIDLSIWAVEETPYVPIGKIAKVLVGPQFKSDEFESFLMNLVIDKKIDVIVPNMDSATLGLSGLKKELLEIGCRAVVSEHKLCFAMEDKILAQEWFVKHNFPIPIGDSYPRILKNRFGFGSRDQKIIKNRKELEIFYRSHSIKSYLMQPFVSGQEYTVDAYVNRDGEILGCLSRKRVKVSDGEVDVSQTHRHPEIIDLTLRLLSIPGWEGPITVQFIDSINGPVLIEVNPRFGGGVTHAIHCGLDMPRWIIREQLNRINRPFNNWIDGSIMTRCRRDIFYDYSC